MKMIMTTEVFDVLYQSVGDRYALRIELDKLTPMLCALYLRFLSLKDEPITERNVKFMLELNRLMDIDYEYNQLDRKVFSSNNEVDFVIKPQSSKGSSSSVATYRMPSFFSSKRHLGGV